ncbi:MAG: 3-hydroxyacyl-CoA dehydrogenase family protein [Bacteroidetes bacterium]|nr:3-hydroxyacyl-CoA dehydrogenase family protein [Bacteroidota bacterium]MBU1718801.1 3-hydroxyacyl-CoA dehydrogenase family protein [Bacteroidota bacterium]
MNYTERLENVTVIGAAGKMGSGILLLTALEMTDLSLMPENKDKTFVLNAVDVSDSALKGLVEYIRGQVQKAAEKKTVALRKVYAHRTDLIENGDIINQYVNDVLAVVRPTTRMEAAYDSKVIFEAIKEDPELKVRIIKQIDSNNKNNPWFYTNTSSIPITQLDETAGLGGRIIGFHFYNPPAIQKLVELIDAKYTQKEVHDFSLEFAKKLKKVVVPSNDFAGFIGNGHFMRDALHGIQEAQRLSANMPLHEAIYMINKVGQDFLVRPMGIFQLIDYVGVDVVSYIMSVMNPHLADENLHSSLLDKMLEIGVKGGQYSSGAQKDGFLKYDKGRAVAVYCTEKRDYVSFESFATKCDEQLGSLPGSYKPWKAVNFSKGKDADLAAYFGELSTMNTMGAQLAKTYNARSNAIGRKLVSDGVANNNQDVNTVMLTGFFHAYGPINEYLK